MTKPCCHGPACASATLIDAHIIPRSFAAYIRGDDPSIANVQLTKHASKNAVPHLGEYDPDILCADCDAKLGQLDDYAIKITRAFPKTAVKSGNFYELADMDLDTLGKFFLSVIWRASISKRATFAEIDLGPYNGVVRDVIFSNASLASNTTLQVALEWIESAHLDASKIFTVPVATTLGGFNGFGFLIGGFRAYVKVDKRPLPANQTNGQLLGKGTLRLYARRFEDTSEFDATADMIVAHHRRAKSGS